MTAGVVVNEARVNAISAGQWWWTFLQRRPHTVCMQSLGGALVWLPCTDLPHAEELARLLADHGVPPTAVRATRLDRDGRIPPTALRGTGCTRATGPMHIPTGEEAP